MRAGLVSLDDVDVKKSVTSYESFRLPKEDRIVLQQALNRLSEMQRKMIYLLFYQDLTQTEAGAK